MRERVPFFEYMRLGEVKRLVQRFDDEMTKRDARAVSLMSLAPGEGRTFLVAVLAVGEAAFLKKKVLIVDTSSQPEGHRFYLKRILGQASLDKYVDFMTPRNSDGGGTDTADFELKQMLRDCRSHYDLVIFDTSALQACGRSTMDPVIVSRAAGNVLMVLSKNSMAYGDFRRLKDEMNEWGIAILGTVYNFGGFQ